MLDGLSFISLNRQLFSAYLGANALDHSQQA